MLENWWDIKVSCLVRVTQIHITMVITNWFLLFPTCDKWLDPYTLVLNWWSVFVINLKYAQRRSQELLSKGSKTYDAFLATTRLRNYTNRWYPLPQNFFSRSVKPHSSILSWLDRSGPLDLPSQLRPECTDLLTWRNLSVNNIFSSLGLSAMQNLQLGLRAEECSAKYWNLLLQRTTQQLGSSSIRNTEWDEEKWTTSKSFQELSKWMERQRSLRAVYVVLISICWAPM